MSKVTVHQQGDDFIVKLPVIVDEETQFPQAVPKLSQRVIFECIDVDIVNSFAMHNWIVWMRKLHPDTQYVFRHCHRKVIEMMNAVEGFLFENAVVESFYLPYNCAECDGEDEILLTRGKEFVESVTGQKPRLLYPNQLNCPKCRNSMAVGILENVYLRFLER
jgi:hypothetical protein